MDENSKAEITASRQKGEGYPQALQAVFEIKCFISEATSVSRRIGAAVAHDGNP